MYFCNDYESIVNTQPLQLDLFQTLKQLKPIQIVNMDFKVLNFTIFCINNVALFLGKSAKEVYHRMQDANIIDGYIVPCYDVLHTFSKEYIVEDLVEFMQKKGALQ